MKQWFAKEQVYELEKFRCESNFLLLSRVADFWSRSAGFICAPDEGSLPDRGRGEPGSSR